MPDGTGCRLATPKRNYGANYSLTSYFLLLYYTAAQKSTKSPRLPPNFSAPYDFALFRRFLNFEYEKTARAETLFDAVEHRFAVGADRVIMIVGSDAFERRGFAAFQFFHHFLYLRARMHVHIRADAAVNFVIDEYVLHRPAPRRR